MTKEVLLEELRSSREFFLRVADALDEKDAAFAPAEGMMTAVQQMAHIAQTVDWMLDGVENPNGFDMDFASHIQKVQQVQTLGEARAWIDRAYKSYIEWVEQASEDSLMTPMAGPIMGGAPRVGAIFGVIDHTAHHRGVLTVYLRLLGKTPPMPYMSEEQIAAMGQQ